MSSTYPSWIFDDTPISDPLGKGQEVVDFFNFLRHPLSEAPEKRLGLPFFWERIYRRIYGPRRENGRRVVRQVFIMMPRGARKTTYVGGGLGLYHTIGKGRRPHGQVLLGAGSEDQAELALNEAVRMVEATPGLVFPDGRKPDKVKIRGDYVEHIADETKLQVTSAEGDTSHGTTPHVAIFDELHVYKNRKLWRALRTGLLKVPDTLLVMITTAGRGQSGLAWDEYQYARKIATGEIVNEAYLPVIFEPPKDADWEDPRVWDLVNPGMAEGFPDMEAFALEAQSVKEKPADRDDFKQYNLNFWLAQSMSPFVDMEVWDEGKEAVDLEAHEQFKDPCFLAVDLGLNEDLSVIVAAWPDGDDGYDLWAWFFCPGDNLEKRADLDKFNYPRWAEERFITPTPGNVTDYTVIEEKLEALCKQFNVQEIAFDPRLASQMMTRMGEKKLPVTGMQQGWVTMSPAIKEFERAVLSRRLKHGGHPILRWNIDNVVVNTDSAGNKTFHKGKSRERIDGAQAAAMAVGRAFNNDAPVGDPDPWWMKEGANIGDAVGETEPGETPTDDAEKQRLADEADADAALDERLRAMLED